MQSLIEWHKEFQDIACEQAVRITRFAYLIEAHERKTLEESRAQKKTAILALTSTTIMFIYASPKAFVLANFGLVLLIYIHKALLHWKYLKRAKVLTGLNIELDKGSKQLASCLARKKAKHERDK